MKTVICSRCGARIDPEAVKCPACGAVQKHGNTRKSKTGKNLSVSRRKAWGFAAAAAALLAVLTVVLCVLGGVFDFVDSSADRMPNVIGQTEGNAREMLDALGLRIEIRTKASEEAYGVVIAQSIAEGKTLKGNQSVTLTISDGSLAERVPEDTQEKEKLLAPNVVGMDFDAAKLQVENLGMNLAKSSEENSQQPEGTILWQDPAEGTEMQRGEVIRCTVSIGPEQEFEITVTAGKGGSVTPGGRVSVKEGEDAQFIITPDKGYEIAELKIDGKDVGALSEYSFTGVDAPHTLYAVFRAVAETDPETPENPGETPIPPIPVTPTTPTDLQ